MADSLLRCGLIVVSAGLISHLLLLWSCFGRILEEELVVVVQDEVINFLLDSLDRVVDQPLSLFCAVGQALPLPCENVIGLLKVGCPAAILLLLLVL